MSLFYSSLKSDGNLPMLASSARLVSLAILIVSAAFGQGQGLSITNYQLVSSQTIQRTLNVTYTANLVNTGTALQAVTAVVTSLNPSMFQVVPGQNILQFGPVPANSQVTSSNTFTLQMVNPVAVDFTLLQWTFETAAILLPANVALTPGETLNFPVTLGTPAPAGGVYIMLASSDSGIATVSPASSFVPEGMTSPRSTPAVTGNSAGSVTVSASAPGYATANAQVLVSSGGTTATAMSFWPGSLAISPAETQNLTLNLSAPGPAGITVSLHSTNVTVATVPATVSFAANATSATVPVTGVAAGSVTITASAPNLASATAGVSVTRPAGGGILLQSSLSVTAGNTANLPVALGAAAGAGSVSITLTSSDPTVASIFPSTITIPEGSTATSRQVPAVTGNIAGTATITASANGYATVSCQVQVTGGGATISMAFSPATLTINGNASQDLTLTLSASDPNGLVVGLTSSNPAVATVPAAMSFGTGTTLSVPVTGVAAGSVTITATATNVATAAARVTVTQPAAGGILLPSGVTITAGNTVNFPVMLGTVAGAGGVSITLASSNSAVVAASPSNFSIAASATSPSNLVPTVRGISAGSATISASAFGYPTASAQVQVTPAVTTAPPTMSFSGDLAITGTATQDLTLNLSSPAPVGLVVSLTSGDVTVAAVPATVTFATGSTTVSVPVTGVATGSVTITASAPNIASATANVTVTVTATQGGSGTILLTASPTVGLNQSALLQVSLAAAAPTAGVTISLASSNNSTASVTPGSVFIAARNTLPSTQAQVNGVGLGSVSITASAPGFTSASAPVQVTSSSGTSSLTPSVGLTIVAGPGSAQDLTLNLSPTPASGLTIGLSSSNTSVATVPATVTYAPNSGTISVPVTGVAAGSATITAVTPGYGTATATVSIISQSGVSVTWYGACWETATIYGYTGNFQAIDFALSTPTPVPVNGTLFFTSNCDPSQGTDNMNDTGATTGSTHMIQGFSHYPGVIPSSAMYWIGNATSNGTCPPGSLCSGCVTYNASTPNCSVLP